jgi:hypothetical protein
VEQKLTNAAVPAAVAPGGPLVRDTDVVGLYDPDRAAAASKWTSTIGDPDGPGNDD